MSVKRNWLVYSKIMATICFAALSLPAYSQIPDGESQGDALPSVPDVNNAKRDRANFDQEFGFSIMFKREDIINLEKVLATIGEEKEEDIVEAAPSEDDILAEILKAAKGDEPEEQEVVVIEEDDSDAILPAFYLSSIIYRNPGDWSLWVNKKRITAKESDRPELGISVRGITKEVATLSWKPSNIDTATERWQQLKEADSVDEIKKQKKHREVAFAKIDFDQEAGEFVVSMRPNQTFFADTMQVLEGKHEVKRVLVEEEPEFVQEPVQDRTGIARRDPLAVERGLANQALGNLKKLGDFIPSGQ